jgi:magnesium-transporting ATPase (P-type)
MSSNEPISDDAPAQNPPPQAAAEQPAPLAADESTAQEPQSNEPVDDGEESPQQRRRQQRSRSPMVDPTTPTEKTPRRKPSVLGERATKKKSSFLARVGIAPSEGGSSRMPERSPTGAIRHASGITFRPPVAQAEAKKGAFTEIEIEDSGTQWHALPLEELYTELKSAPEGLTTQAAKDAIAVHGLNQITPPTKIHPFLLFLLSLVHGFQLMMNVGAILCFVVFFISGSTDVQTLALAIILIVVTVLTSAFQTFQEGKTDNMMEELRAMVADSVWVYRDGEMKTIPAEQLTLGDIVQV